MLSERRGVSPDPAPANESGNEGAVDTLWEWNYVNRDTADEIDGTPFPWPPGDVREGITNVNFDLSDVSGRTPFP